ncbi:MAG: phosphoribosyltransferase family protein [Pirellulaceae bacterium]
MILTAKRPGGAPLAYGIGQLVGDLLSRQLARQSYTLVTAAPVHWRRQLQRGFNGAERIMCGLQSRLESLSAVMLLVHRRPTRKQAMLPMNQRNKNVRGAFRIRPGHDLTGQRILLVDDVMTTGETAGELSRILLKAGASRVDLLMIARGLPVPREEGNGFETMQTGSLAPDRRSGKNVSDSDNRARQ